MTPISYPAVGAMGKTGNWRISKPILDKDRCVIFLRCWIFCPEAVIWRNKDDSVDIDYEYCKGCGICANVYQLTAIKRVRKK